MVILLTAFLERSCNITNISNIRYISNILSSTIVTEEISRNQSKRPALKFLANYDQKFFDKRQRHIGLIISSLGALIEKDLDSETIEEAAHALTQLANRSLEVVKSEKKQRDTIIPSTAAPGTMELAYRI